MKLTDKDKELLKGYITSTFEDKEDSHVAIIGSKIIIDGNMTLSELESIRILAGCTEIQIGNEHGCIVLFLS